MPSSLFARDSGGGRETPDMPGAGRVSSYRPDPTRSILGGSFKAPSARGGGADPGNGDGLGLKEKAPTNAKEEPLVTAKSRADLRTFATFMLQWKCFICFACF